MKLKIIFTLIIIFCCTLFASSNRNTAGNECTCPVKKAATGVILKKCAVTDIADDDNYLPMAGFIHWLY